MGGDEIKIILISLATTKLCVFCWTAFFIPDINFKSQISRQKLEFYVIG